MKKMSNKVKGNHASSPAQDTRMVAVESCKVQPCLVIFRMHLAATVAFCCLLKAAGCIPRHVQAATQSRVAADCRDANSQPSLFNCAIALGRPCCRCLLGVHQRPAVVPPRVVSFDHLHPRPCSVSVAEQHPNSAQSTARKTMGSLHSPVASCAPFCCLAWESQASTSAR